jgi:hypothetical protein
MNRILVVLLLMLSAAFARTEASETSEYASVLDGLSDVAWTTTPNDMLKGVKPNLSLVRLGIEAVDVSESAEKEVTLEFLCRHLELVDPNPRALTQQPFRVRLSIHLTPMTDLDDQDDTLGVIDRIHDAVVALPDAISIRVSRQFLATGRPRVTGESLDSRHEPLQVGLLRDGLQFFDRRALDGKSISCHGASAP